MSKLAYFVQKLWFITGTPKLVRDTISFASAIISGVRVSEERIEKRIAICTTCENLYLEKDMMICNECGCPLKQNLELRNLAAYEESGLYGCPHKNGSRWKEAGV